MKAKHMVAGIASLGLAMAAILLFPSTTTSQTVSGATPQSPESILGRAHGVLPDREGGCILVGERRSNPKGDLEFALVQLDGRGRLRWSDERHFPLQDAANAVAATPDGGFIAAGYSYRKDGFGRHDFYLAKYKPAEAGESQSPMQFEWDRLWGKPFREIAFWVGAEDDGYLAAGQTKSLGILGDFYLIKTNLEGEILWERHYEANYTDYAYALARKGSGYWLAGTVSGFHYPSQADHHHTDADIMLLRLDADGHELDRKFYGGPRNDFCRAMHPVEEGGAYLFGSTQSSGAGNFDMQLSRVDEQMELQWQKTYGGKGLEYGLSLAADSAGNLYLWGTTSSFGEGQNGYLIKVRPDGSPAWSLELGTRDSDYGEGIALAEGEGRIYLAGYRRLGLGEDYWAAWAVDTNGRLAWEGTLWDEQCREVKASESLPPGTYLQRGSGLDGLPSWARLVVH